MRHFTSDHHFWHLNILKYCPNRKYATVQGMNEDFIQKWNAVVNPSDEVYYLGDFSLSTDALKIREHLNGTVYLIPGNHDKCHCTVYKKNENKKKKMLKLYEDAGFIILPEKFSTVLKLNEHAQEEDKIAAQLCHFPYKVPLNGEHVSNFSDVKPEPTILNQVLLHGHVHQHWKSKVYEHPTLGSFPMINVGVDVWNGYPVSETTLYLFAKELLKQPNEALLEQVRKIWRN